MAQQLRAESVSALRQLDEAANGQLARAAVGGHPARADDEQGIYRDEVMEIFDALADNSSDTVQILAILRGDNEEDDDAEEEPLDP